MWLFFFHTEIYKMCSYIGHSSHSTLHTRESLPSRRFPPAPPPSTIRTMTWLLKFTDHSPYHKCTSNISCLRYFLNDNTTKYCYSFLITKNAILRFIRATNNEETLFLVKMTLLSLHVRSTLYNKYQFVKI